MKKVFLHEPDRSIFEVISYVLSDSGYLVKALPKFNHRLRQEIVNFKPGLIIIDYFRDLFTPLSICRLARSVDPNIGLIGLSCNTDLDKTYRKMGFDCFLQKPFDIDHLLDTVKTHSEKTVTC